MCQYCEDLRYIAPAKSVSFSDCPEPEWLTEARRQNQFVQFMYQDFMLAGCRVIDECPVCHKKLNLSKNEQGA